MNRRIFYFGTEKNEINKGKILAKKPRRFHWCVRALYAFIVKRCRRPLRVRVIHAEYSISK